MDPVLQCSIYDCWENKKVAKKNKNKTQQTTVENATNTAMKSKKKQTKPKQQQKISTLLIKQ